MKSKLKKKILFIEPKSLQADFEKKDQGDKTMNSNISTETKLVQKIHTQIVRPFCSCRIFKRNSKKRINGNLTRP